MKNKSINIKIRLWIARLLTSLSWQVSPYRGAYYNEVYRLRAVLEYISVLANGGKTGHNENVSITHKHCILCTALYNSYGNGLTEKEYKQLTKEIRDSWNFDFLNKE